jgi:hypothetical protein
MPSPPTSRPLERAPRVTFPNTGRGNGPASQLRVAIT